MRVIALSSFAKTKRGGNPAGVCLFADALSDAAMRRIAKGVGFSETAFVKPSNRADFKVQFFTPEGEVDLCGHATIATYILLAERGLVKRGKYTQETKAGILGIDVVDAKTVYMNQALPKFSEKVPRPDIAACLNIPEEALGPLQPQVVSTGLRDILVQVRDLDTLLSLKPDFDRMSALSKGYRTIGVHAFTLETKFESAAHCRNFAPLYGIPEESATGTSNGALSCYLFKYGVISPAQAKHLIYEQGYSMKKPSEILAKLTIQAGRIKAVQVGGTALVTKALYL